MIHILTEDKSNSSTVQFWRFLIQNQVHDALYGADVVGFSGNSLLVDYLRRWLGY